MRILNSFLRCTLVKHYLEFSRYTDLWEVLSKNIYLIFDKNKRKTVNPMLTLFLKTSNCFIKVVAASQANETYSRNKHFIWLLPPIFFYSARQKCKYNYINRLLSKLFCLQPFSPEDSVSLLVCLVHQRENFWNLVL